MLKDAEIDVHVSDLCVHVSACSVQGLLMTVSFRLLYVGQLEDTQAKTYHQLKEKARASAAKEQAALEEVEQELEGKKDQANSLREQMTLYKHRKETLLAEK